jgi:hypothetical protein
MFSTDCATIPGAGSALMRQEAIGALGPTRIGNPKNSLLAARISRRLSQIKTHYVNQHIADSTPVIAAPLAPDLPQAEEARKSPIRSPNIYFRPCKFLRRQAKKFNIHGALRRF